MQENMACLVCGRDNPHRVCDRCQRATSERLKSLPGYYDRLGDCLKPGSPTGAPRVSGGAVTAPLPLRLEVLNLRGPGGIVATLTECEDAWRELLGWTARPFRGDTRQTVQGCTGFLGANWLWACDKHPDPAGFASDIRELVESCRLHTDGRSAVRLIGPCPAVLEDDSVCRADLWAAPGLSVIRCRRCRSTWSEREWLKLAEAMRRAG